MRTAGWSRMARGRRTTSPTSWRPRPPPFSGGAGSRSSFILPPTAPRAPRPPPFNGADGSDKPQWLRRPQLAARQAARLDQLYRRRLQSLQAVDDAIGTLVDTLRATGELQRTFI